MDNITMVQIIVYGVGALGIVFGLLTLKYGEFPAAKEEQKK